MAEKQQKILNKIRYSINSGNKTPVGTKPNDECYTSLQDILTEMNYWANKGKFKGKNIICPCDWDIVEGQDIYSIRITYNDSGVDVVGNDVQKIEEKYDLWYEDPPSTTIKLKEEEIDDFLKNKLTCNFVRTFTQNARAWGIKSITASGYNPANGKGVPFQQVDYSKYDICCTNPPFSLYADFMKCIVDKIDFICLAPFLNRATPNIGLHLMLKKVYLGYGCDLHDMMFDNLTKDGIKRKSVTVDWITSFSDAQDERNELHYNPNINYEDYKEYYPVMENMTMKDGTHPIRVPGSQWPDYSGWMFSSITVLDKLDQNNYEWYGTNFSGYYNKENPGANPFLEKVKDKMYDLGGKRMFAGIVFRKKPEENKQCQTKQ